jgi:hypothetical protein
VRRAMRSACTAAEIESPFPSASEKRRMSYQSDWLGEYLKLTRKASLADLAPSPVQIIALEADPITRLLYFGK